MSAPKPATFFSRRDTKIGEEVNFLVKRSVPENFQWENFSGQVPTESLRTQDSENIYERWVPQMFDPVLVAQSISSKMNQRLVIVYDPTQICFGTDILKIVAVSIFCNGSF